MKFEEKKRKIETKIAILTNMESKFNQNGVQSPFKGGYRWPQIPKIPNHHHHKIVILGEKCATGPVRVKLKHKHKLWR